MTARSFVWLSIGGGAWGLGSNWADTTDGESPSVLAPGAQDNVAVTGPTGAAVQTITGPGLAAAAVFTGNSLLSGSFSIGALTLGQAASGGLLELAGNAALQCGTANIVSGSLLAGAGSSLSVSGTLGLGSAGGQAAFNVTGGGAASVASLFLGAATDSIYVDTASVLEVGGAGQGRAGRLTVDAGGTLSGQGNANAFGAVANNGTISAQGGTLAVGTLSGTGALVIGAGATLALDGACAAGQGVSFAGANATLALQAEFDAPAGVLSGFAAGDAIDVEGSLISGASFQAAGAQGGTLTLLYGTQVAATLLLSGSYGGDVFLTSGDGAGGTLVTLAASASGGGGVAPGTSTPDQYGWIGGSSGRWNVAAGWTDITKGQSPANLAPGSHDLVTITGAAATFDVIAGPGNAASLTTVGEVALTGAFGVGTLAVGNITGAAYAAGTLDLLAGATLTAVSAAVSDGELSVSGSLSTLTASGTLVIGGTPFGVGQPTAALDVTAGGSVQAGTLQMGGGAGDSIVTDPTGTLEIGSAGHAAAGAVTVDAGAQLNGNGSINPYGVIVDNGTILASGGTLSLGAVSGSGRLAVGAGATLELLAATSDPISLLGSAGNGGSVLAFAGGRAAPTGLITGLVAGDAIDLEGSPLTGVQLVQGSGSATLVLGYGSAVVARLSLAGSFTSQRFVVLPDGNGGSLISLTSTTGSGGGSQQTGTDQLAWTNPVSGAWGRSANWTDNTQSAQASAPPGAQTPVVIAGPGGTVFEDITGQGTCASLSASGNTILSGTFATGLLTGGAGALVLGVGATLTAAQAAFAGTEMLASGIGAALAVSGTLSLATGALLATLAHGGVQCGTLDLGGGAVSVDVSSSVEVGTLGGAALGTVTIDAGALASGSGAIDAAGSVTDNGVILAQGGTLTLGTVSGSGSLEIGTGATLALLAADTCPVGFAGNGATLLIGGAALPASVISGFQAGDGIVTADTPIDSVSYRQGSAGLGSLTLSEAGQVIGQLLLAGSFAGETFAVQPDGTGTEITVGTQAASGPPAGTATPDAYVWSGGQGPLWSAAGNWTDQTSGQTPAAVAPGLNDSVSVAGGNGAALALDGPANAATLSISGTVALAGAFSFGTLAVGGTGGPTGVLALGSGATVSAGVALIDGGVALNGGNLSVGATLALGTAGLGGVLDVASGLVEAGALTLAGPGSALLAGLAGAAEIGGLQNAAAGTVQIDAGGVLSGAGSVSAANGIADNGTIVASGGTLALGGVSGTGTLLVGVGAELALTGSSGSQLTADFAGGGTLALGAAALANSPQIADFGVGDQILLAAKGATSASYAQTAPGSGVLTIEAGTQTLAQLTLLGDQAGLAFTVTGSAGGGTILTAAPDNTSGQEGNFMTNPSTDTGFQVNQQSLDANLQNAGLGYAISEVNSFLGINTFNEWLSADGQAPSTSYDWMAPFLPYMEVVGPLTQSGVSGSGPLSAFKVLPGYTALIAEGGEPLTLSDNSAGGDLIVGNSGGGNIYAHAGSDTLVGAAGANTLFETNLTGASNTTNGNTVFIHGGGNDTISTNNDSAAVTTSGGSSEVLLGTGGNNTVTLDGSDTVICGAGPVNSVTVNAAVGLGHNVAFGPASGTLNFQAGATQSIVVGEGGQINMYGGSGSSLLFAANSSANFIGGTGAAAIVGGSGETYVQGGAAPVDVFGGSGNLILTTPASGSTVVVNQGNNNIAAGAGLDAWLGGSSNNTVAGSAGAFVFGGTNFGNNVFNAGAGSETLWGGLGADTFQGGTGHALLESGGGQDVFNFLNGSDGQDTIGGFVVGQDTIDLSGYGSTAPQITYGYGDSILNLQDGSQIVVYGVSNLTASSISMK